MGEVVAASGERSTVGSGQRDAGSELRRDNALNDVLDAITRDTMLRAAWLVTAGIAVAVGVLSLIPKPEDLVPFHLWDKVEHLLAYAGLSWALCYAMRLSGYQRRSILFGGILLSAAYGGLLEIAQFFAPLRSPDIEDASVNLLGASLGAGCFLFLNALVRRLSPSGSTRTSRDWSLE